MPFGQGEVPFGIADAKVATYTGPDTYGSLADIMSVEMADSMVQVVSALGRGDNRITTAVSMVEGTQLQVRFTGISLAALAIMAGKEVTSTEDTDQLQFVGGEHLPYFGFICRTDSEDGSDAHAFFPKCKIMENFRLIRGEYGQLSTTELTIQCVPDDIWGVSNLYTHPTATEITAMPPADIAEVPA